ncbi:XAC0095 family protein [Dyella acidiphila]|uniref:XAC0095-like domain-containing protein n=1 Tax=Dyella acidiphila TaxID=2775866 RepID=A0ABR9GF50_9GAMM|nr:hypothetical protein [Dyella acidiphila]MBE1162677.1 hypothetical protein [Dyella acidiphila]
MNDARHAAAAGVCLALPEQAHSKLAQLRDHLGLLAQMTYAVTKEEEDKPLEIRRSVLGTCFEMAAVQLEDALHAVEHATRTNHRSSSSPLRGEDRGEGPTSP